MSSQFHPVAAVSSGAGGAAVRRPKASTAAAAAQWQPLLQLDDQVVDFDASGKRVTPSPSPVPHGLPDALASSSSSSTGPRRPMHGNPHRSHDAAIDVIHRQQSSVSNKFDDDADAADTVEIAADAGTLQVAAVATAQYDVIEAALAALDDADTHTHSHTHALTHLPSDVPSASSRSVAAAEFESNASSALRSTSTGSHSDGAGAFVPVRTKAEAQAAAAAAVGNQAHVAINGQDVGVRDQEEENSSSATTMASAAAAVSQFAMLDDVEAALAEAAQLTSPDPVLVQDPARNREVAPEVDPAQAYHAAVSETVLTREAAQARSRAHELAAHAARVASASISESPNSNANAKRPAAGPGGSATGNPSPSEAGEEECILS